MATIKNTITKVKFTQYIEIDIDLRRKGRQGESVCCTCQLPWKHPWTPNAVNSGPSK